MGRGKQETKKIIRTLNEWNKEKYLVQEEFCRSSFKMNRKKIIEFADLVMNYVFFGYVDLLKKRSESPLGRIGMSRSKVGEIEYMIHDAGSMMKAIEESANNEELFQAQKRLREICAVFVDEGLKNVSLTE